MTITDTLRALEEAARPLEPDASARAASRDAVVAYAEEFLEAIATMPAYVITDDKGKGIYGTPIGERPIPVAEAIRLLRHNVDRPGLDRKSTRLNSSH